MARRTARPKRKERKNIERGAATFTQHLTTQLLLFLM